MPGGEKGLKECLKENKNLKVASNGSLNEDSKMASFRWHLIGKCYVLVEGAGPVDGVQDLLSSTRPELFGIAVPGTLHKILGICHFGGKKLKMLIFSFHSCGCAPLVSGSQKIHYC